MKYESTGEMTFFSQMSERQITSCEFFNNVLHDSLGKHLGLKNVMISYFDTKGKFLSWINQEGILVDSEEHPYRKFVINDIVRHTVYQDAIRDRLTYFNVNPRLYKSTDIINCIAYENSAYVRFLEENFNSHYSLSMAFGMNAYIQVVFLKTQEQGDFTDEEIEKLNKIYVYIANCYKNFKKHEQAKIVLNIQNEIISSGEKAYLVTDNFMHIMSYNNIAKDYLRDILGVFIDEEFSTTKPCSWLPFLLGDDEENINVNRVYTRVIKNYIFKIYTHDQIYSNGIIDRYHWITISKNTEENVLQNTKTKLQLTQSEQKVAELMYKGLTYKAIADELVVSYHTVKKHVQNIYTKCNVQSRFQLYKYLEENE
ncbi:MAG: response regulator transcription factor [Peptostreptococcaceae bacterium]